LRRSSREKEPAAAAAVASTADAVDRVVVVEEVESEAYAYEDANAATSTMPSSSNMNAMGSMSPVWAIKNSAASSSNCAASSEDCSMAVGSKKGESPSGIVGASVGFAPTKSQLKPVDAIFGWWGGRGLGGWRSSREADWKVTASSAWASPLKVRAPWVCASGGIACLTACSMAAQRSGRSPVRASIQQEWVLGIHLAELIATVQPAVRFLFGTVETERVMQPSSSSGG